MTTSRTERHSTTPQGRPKLNPAVLGHYCGRQDDQRELRCLHLPDGRLLVVDWRLPRRADARLVGELAAGEPTENAAVLARVYLKDPSRGRCRKLCAGDLHAAPQHPHNEATESEPVRDEGGASYAIAAVDCGTPCRVLRWTRRALRVEEPQVLRLREVVSHLQSYEPARSLTLAAIARHEHDKRVSVCLLRAELERIDSSSVVLNTRLREAVLERVGLGESLSEIAMRCGRMKRGSNGSVSGETSWLSRRIGARAEGGRAASTPWVHSDVLALIAREGLGLCPADVEAH